MTSGNAGKPTRVFGQDTDKNTASQTQAIQPSSVSGVSRRVRVPSAPPTHVYPCSPSEMVRRGFRPFSAVLCAIPGSRQTVLMDRRPWTWVHGQNTDNDTSSQPGPDGWKQTGAPTTGRHGRRQFLGGLVEGSPSREGVLRFPRFAAHGHSQHDPGGRPRARRDGDLGSSDAGDLRPVQHRQRARPRRCDGKARRLRSGDVQGESRSKLEQRANRLPIFSPLATWITGAHRSVGRATSDL